ncbi:MAG: alpha-hydroxy-acid oxidizing protein [Rhizobiales bacterium]|nr:alpha-hydroxy-acid oxidizing protein [Hyphomicrobiales bacterium]
MNVSPTQENLAKGATAVPPPATVNRPENAVPRNLRRYLSLEDFEPAAKRVLPRMLYGYISGGAETDASVRDNKQAYQEYGLVPRVLMDVSGRDTSTTLLGKRYAAPFGIPPLGSAALCAYRGDIVLTRAAAAMSVPMILSAASLIKLEDVKRENPDAWYQAYLAGDDVRVEAMVDRVAAAGYDTFVVTADVPVPPNRENNIRNGFQVPLAITPQVAWDVATHPRWLFGNFVRTVMNHGMPHFENMDAAQGPPVLSKELMRNIGKRDQLAWKHVELIRRRWKGKLIVKGLLAPEDARTARECGADGVIVSNHGGRQLDGAVSALRTLPEIAAQANGMTVIVDGGIRRGTDILKALALGADFVFIGRPFLYAAVVGGEAGVTRALTLLRAEIDRDMALLGIRTLDEITSDMVHSIR